MWYAPLTKYDKVTTMRESTTFTVSLPPAMAKEIERAMKAEHRTRSELVREALRVYLSARLIPAELPTPAEVRAYRSGMAAYRRGDATRPISRRYPQAARPFWFPPSCWRLAYSLRSLIGTQACRNCSDRTAHFDNVLKNGHAKVRSLASIDRPGRRSEE